MTRRLTRAQDGRPAAPVRIVHLGLGNFFRAHEAMYTEKAPDAAQWGIAAFTGRSVAMAEAMAEQDGLYELIVQNPEGNDYEVISAISATHSGSDVARFVEYFRDPAVAIVSSTITEAGYLPGADGGVDLSAEAVQADVAALKAGDLTAVTTAPGKFVAGLLARREAGAGPITFLPGDNVPDNGHMVAGVLTSLAAAVDPTLSDWMADNVGFATTMVDRITPSISEEAREALAADRGIEDPAAVATEPFTEWVIAGDFKAGRPAWEDAGVQFVDDITPHELRKLWLLNGSHSLMAYAATIVGRPTVYEAISDPVVAGWVDQWWDVAAKHLPLPAAEVDAYRAALLERFGNPRMKDQLSRIAADGSVKIPIRIVPALNAERAAGGEPIGAERAVAAWVLHTRGLGAPVNDAKADVVASIGAGTLEESVAKASDYLGIDDAGARESILALARELEAAAA
ncbi:mannitol dehydrogenase family protein [Propioniciclava coleopterorum]|uniref:mannitol dehydrogenase family protein n=1 Tax=Propioniciclava coleopterorum TaxID=2714937 RepID=UPI001FE5C7B2|nr:mannitol dehydrogenase family protein [Propioniciclava coleopterorum]